MRTTSSSVAWLLHRILTVALVLSATALGQVSIASLNDRFPDNPVPVNPGSAGSAAAGTGAAAASPVAPGNLPEAAPSHKFWDNKNIALFTTVAALSTADFAVTRANLQNGGRELNPVTRLFTGSTAGLACNFAGQTATVIGLSYYFHKKGHHQLERITPMLNIGASSVAVAYDLSHR